MMRRRGGLARISHQGGWRHRLILFRSISCRIFTVNTVSSPPACLTALAVSRSRSLGRSSTR